MHAPSNPQRRPRRAATVILGLVVLLGLTLSSRAEILESLDDNYEMEIPHGWVKLPSNPSWAELGIKVGAIRQLETLKDGSTAKGEGGMLHLAITDLPEGKTLDDLAKEPEVRGFLLKRFSTKPSGWPDVRVVNNEDPDTGLAMRIFYAEGKAPNLDAKKKLTKSLMVLAVAKQKVYKLRVYVWPTEFDGEGLGGDLDVIEMNFVIPDIKEETSEGDRPPPPTDEEESEDAPNGDEAEEKTVEDLAVGWRLVKPVGLKSHDWDKASQPDAVAWFEDSDNVGSYQIILYVIRRGRQNDKGQQVPDMVLKNWGLKPWWKQFSPAHEDGPIRTFKWPRSAKRLLTLPDFEAERTLFEEAKDRPEEMDATDMLKKYKFAQKIKGVKIGKEKAIEAYRAVLGGTRARYGNEIMMRFMWGTPRVTCMLIVGLTRDGPMKWSDEIQTLMDSIEMTGRPR